ncbi:MAG: DNA polymerase III subunit alpha, partial [Gemmatimonadota bacterium]|nr:DNA polymerase III subunit alpha [Gemmatimonadota bacterium]
AGRIPDGDLYVELCPTGETGGNERLHRLAYLARELGLPLVATANVHFVDPGDWNLHRLLRAIDLGTTLDGLGKNDVVQKKCWLAGPYEMARRLKKISFVSGADSTSAAGQALANTARIAGRCNVELPTGRVIFPEVRLPEGESAYSRLLKAAFRGACRRYRPMRAEVLGRLRTELEVIDRLGYSAYFLAVARIARFARRARIPMVGRGSAANSLVAYTLGITEVDPLRYNLFFERFLNPERGQPPDIDLDFSWRRRDDVLDYVYRTWGADRVAMICTYVTFNARLAFRETARAMGLAPGRIDRFCRVLPRRALQHLDCLEQHWPECRALPVGEEPYRSILKLAARIEGFPRHLSIHAGGIVISPFPLTDLVPLERSAKGLVVTQYDMSAIEELGLVKIDLLSQRSLAVVEEVLRTVERRTGRELDLEDVDRLAADPETAHLIETGRTIGCFYIESPAMRSLLVKLRVRTFEMLTAASSVIRPGVAESGMMDEFIGRHNGERKISYLHPSFEKLLGETYGVMIYQEDVVRVAHEIAGMSLGEADMLRRAMSGKMRSRKAMELMRRRFLEGAAGRGVSREAAAEIWRQIQSFAGYAFCKAHSASYARVSFQVAWLKAHYPAEFMAAVLANGGGFYGPSAYIEEARRMGLAILPPDINRSGLGCKGAGRRVRMGLAGISNISRRCLERIVETRRAGGFFTSLRDFCARVRPALAEVQTLIRCGAFDCFELTRPELLWRLEFLFARRAGQNPGEKNGGDSAGGGSASLFPGLDPSAAAAMEQVVPRLPEYSFRTRLGLEHEILGFTVSAHPLAIAGTRRPGTGNGGPPLVAARELQARRGQRVRIIGRPIARKRIRTSKNQSMMFLSLDDPGGTFEVVIFPGCYRRYAIVAIRPGPLLVTGKVVSEYGVFTIVADRLESWQAAPLAAARGNLEKSGIIRRGTGIAL